MAFAKLIPEPIFRPPLDRMGEANRAKLIETLKAYGVKGD
jgi:hypothetical protein